MLEQLSSTEERVIILGQEPNVRRALTLETDENVDCFIRIKGIKQRPERWMRSRGLVAVEFRDLVLVSVYFSPNGQDEDFEDLLDELERITRKTKKVVIGGDFNARTASAGDTITNRRGQILEEWLAKNDLLILNTPGVATYTSIRGSSVIDLTISTQQTAEAIKGWRVEAEEETLSDHELVSYWFDHIERPSERQQEDTRRWVTTKPKLLNLQRRFADECQDTSDPETLTKAITRTCEKVFTRRREGEKIAKYWWNEDVAKSRKVAMVDRRRLQRLRRRSDGGAELTQEAARKYAQSRKELQIQIKRSKEKRWRELCDELEDNPWGTAYQVAVKRIGQQRRTELDRHTIHEQFGKLFPVIETEDSGDEELNETGEETPPFTMEELQRSVDQLKANKAPGEDKITNEILAACVKAKPTCFLDTYNRCMQEGLFPEAWKRGKLVLIPKPRKQNEQQAYRPLCMLNVIGKLMERLINNRLVEYLRTAQKISKWQFGYTKGRGTVDAVMTIIKKSREIKSISLTHRKLMVVVMLDVRNAFNTVPWKEVRGALREKGVEFGIRRILRSYLADRKIILPDGEEKDVNCGVQQGSVIGGTLWNVCYDQVLRLETEEGVSVVGYADDVAILIEGRTEDEVRDKAEYAVEQARSKLVQIGLALAEEKTEVVILEGRRKFTNIQIRVGNTLVSSTPAAKYLGIYLDKDLKMTTHVKKTVEKALKIQTSLAKLMPRVGGPSTEKRIVLSTVVQSVLLYGAPAWEVALKYKKYTNMIRSVERKMAVRVTSAYRTVATDAIGVIARCPPYDLLVWERSRNWEDKGENRSETRAELMRRWQRRWSEYQGWAKTFIQEVQVWVEMGLRTCYHTTQALTGHGVFRSYLKTIKKQEDDECWYDCGEADTPEHCIFRCHRFESERTRMEIALGRQFRTPEHAQSLMGVKQSAQSILDYLRMVMKEKDAEERRRENILQP